MKNNFWKRIKGDNAMFTKKAVAKQIKESFRKREKVSKIKPAIIPRFLVSTVCTA